MSEIRDLLALTSDLAGDWLESLPDRPVLPAVDVAELRRALGGPLPDAGADAADVVARLARDAEPGLTAMPSGRWFGFVIGGSLPVALAADWLTSAWDQNAGLFGPTPTAAVVEDVAGGWLRDLLGLPESASYAFVTGCQMAHATCLAAARHDVLARHGWDVERDGLLGAPRVRILAGTHRHASIDRALRLLGLGTACIDEIACDETGRMVPAALDAALERPDGPTIVSVQAGEINTGAYDDVVAAADAARRADAWLHVDGAFGLWAAASPSYRHLLEGVERADSWATDAHKWLNVPYDSGLAFCRHPAAHRAAMSIRASYLVQAGEEENRDPLDWTPEFSRRARAFAVYAALRHLGRSGVAELVERSCAHARRFGEELARLPGCEVLNDVVLNQVLLRFRSDDETERVLAAVQRAGAGWMSGTTWQGRRAIRISVCNWATTDDEVSRTVAAFADASRSSGVRP